MRNHKSHLPYVVSNPSRNFLIRLFITLMILNLLLFPGCNPSVDQDPIQTPVEPQQESTPVPPDRYSYLVKGINLAFWFWLPQTEEDDIQSRFDDYDFDFLRKTGFTFVRLPIDLSYLLDEADADLLNDERLAEVDTALDRLISAGLAVVIDIHSTASIEDDSPVFSERLEDGSDFLPTFLTFWENLALHLSTRDPDRVFLELLNEPVFENNPEDWPPILTQLAASARRGAPEHTLLVSGAYWSNIDGLLMLDPLPDQNVIYYFHFYEPFPFTHQGADWAGPEVLTLQDVPYPSSPEAVQNAISLAGSRRDRQTISDYGDERWNYEKIRARIQLAADWAKTHNVHLLCDEFGAYGETIPSEQRAIWVKDVRQALESFGIGWAMWEYDGDFALVSREAISCGPAVYPDHNLLEALGLKTGIP